MQRKLAIVGAALCAALYLTGCASAGKNFDSRQVLNIQKNQTREADLVQMFGEPNNRGMRTGGVKTLQWVYAEARVKGETFIPFAGPFLGGNEVKTKTLTVTLNEDGTVKDYEYSGGGLDSRGNIGDDPEKK